MTRFIVHDLQAATPTHLRRASTPINPRYLVIDNVEHEVVDEFTTKRVALDTARDLNNSQHVDALDDAAHHNH